VSLIGPAGVRTLVDPEPAEVLAAARGAGLATERTTR
jgi:hypothetical protein